MSLVITGATGHLGRLVVEALLARGTEPSTITATGRSIERISDLAERGVRVLAADFADPASLDAAFAGADAVLLVSGTDPDRVAQHRAVIDAAVRAGVGRLVYTSAPHADTTTMLLAADHRTTERALAASGLATTVLRNAWYVENYTGQLATYREHGMAGAAGGGRVSVALRREYAEAAAAVLTGAGHEGRTYELGGPAVTLPEVAAAISAASGSTIGYTDLPVAAYEQVLLGAGLPAPAAAVFADVDRAIGDGELAVDPSDLEALLGRPVTPLDAAVAAALATS